MVSNKDIVEPGSVVLFFTLGTLWNRRRSSKVELPSSPRRLPTHYGSEQGVGLLVIPDNTPSRRNLLSRFVTAFPFLVEIWYWLLIYWVYQLARAYSAYLVHDSSESLKIAERHATSILSLERRLGVDMEKHLQRYILSSSSWIMPLLAKVYYSHIAIGVAFLGYTYRFVPHGTYTKIRRTIAMNNFIAFVILTIYRCAPPRLMPKSYGYIDVLHPHSNATSLTPSSKAEEFSSTSIWNDNHFQLTIAAMPSLHFGTSLFLAVCMIRFSPHPFLRIIAPLWPTAMLLTILATANHWVIDAMVGSFVPYIGWRLSWLFATKLFLAIDGWCFRACRIEKPFIEDDTIVAEDEMTR
ncbi:hypothetical protein P154DRAFT_117485 [Amniculicola lignicola CBS 123094]|uniref:Inositolphosphotransferase Aur1/Ipt1 domain-containing protein n=1 Tax=Amniculicola lignicola CBS 123094 TaxID=1392246 RepID=A0A6A5X336_9PLEO|nr:hypothetical protein P154DRAFT_117485 [Amniculicola lignicola CBS 123094]